MTLSIGVACVGLGRAACTQPQDAQVPRAIIALAPAAARLSFSINGRPLLIQNIPLLAQRRITFYCEDIFAIVLRDDVFKDFFRPGSGGSHQSIVIIEGNQGKDDVLRQWVSGADKRFGTAGAFQTVDPYHRNARFVLQRPVQSLVPFPRLIPATWQPDYNI